MVYTSDYPILSVTVDLVWLARRQGRWQVLLVERGADPFAGRLALPGGYVDIDEDLEPAARRELAEETGLEAPSVLEQLAAYGRPGRDPRGRTITVAYLAVSTHTGDLAGEPSDDPVGGSDAAHAAWYDVDEMLRSADRLAFDHRQILADAADRAGWRMPNG